eukprot:1141364-Pelagomonas_calceolata.AAC.3
MQLPFSRVTHTSPPIAFLHSTKSESKHCIQSFRQHVQGHALKKITQLVRNSPTLIYLYKVKSHAGIAGNEYADAIAKHQAIQSDDTPADTTFPCVNLQRNPFHDTAWLAFKESARTHASTSERPGSPALKFKHFSSLHGALRTNMHFKHRHRKANTQTGYYSSYQSLLPAVYKRVSNAFWTMPTIPFKLKRSTLNYRTGTLFNQKHAERF